MSIFSNRKSAQRTQQNSRSQGGYLLVLVFVISATLTTILLSVMSVVSSQYAKTGRDIDLSSAVYVAEAGISDTTTRLSENPLFSGYPDTTAGRKVFYSDAGRGSAEYATTITDNGNDTVTVRSIGYVYNDTAKQKLAAKRTIEATMRRTIEPLTQNLVAGGGGLAYTGSYFNWFGTTGLTKGSIYSRGKVIMGNSSTSIGSTSESIQLEAANYSCGDATNYPQQCPASSPPLVFNVGSSWSGSSGDSKIYGTVCATDQPASANILPGPTGQGLKPGCKAPIYSAPYFNKGEFTSTKTGANVMTGVAASCSSLTTKTIPAGTRIDGNVTIGGSGGFWGCNWVVSGDIYITGSLTLTGPARIVVSDSVGTKRPTVVVNGKVTIEPKGSTSSNAGVFANSSGTPVFIMSFWSTDAAGCSAQPDCTQLSRAHAYNSAQQSTGTGMWSDLFMTGTTRAITIKGAADSATFSGLLAYAYFATVLYNVEGNSSIRGIGGEGVAISPSGANPFVSMGGNVALIDTSPFVGIMGRATYDLIDYRQIHTP